MNGRGFVKEEFRLCRASRQIIDRCGNCRGRLRSGFASLFPGEGRGPEQRLILSAGCERGHWAPAFAGEQLVASLGERAPDYPIDPPEPAAIRAPAANQVAYTVSWICFPA